MPVAERKVIGSNQHLGDLGLKGRDVRSGLSPHRAPHGCSQGIGSENHSQLQDPRTLSDLRPRVNTAW